MFEGSPFLTAIPKSPLGPGSLLSVTRSDGIIPCDFAVHQRQVEATPLTKIRRKPTGSWDRSRRWIISFDTMIDDVARSMEQLHEACAGGGGDANYLYLENTLPVHWRVKSAGESEPCMIRVYAPLMNHFGSVKS